MGEISWPLFRPNIFAFFIISNFNILLRFESRALGMRVVSKIRAKFAHFGPCETRGGIVEMCVGNFYATPRF